MLFQYKRMPFTSHEEEVAIEEMLRQGWRVSSTNVANQQMLLEKQIKDNRPVWHVFYMADGEKVCHSLYAEDIQEAINKVIEAGECHGNDIIEAKKMSN